MEKGSRNEGPGTPSDDLSSEKVAHRVGGGSLWEASALAMAG